MKTINSVKMILIPGKMSLVSMIRLNVKVSLMK